MSSTVNIKASGLVVSPNQLEVPAGSMSEASNIIIKRDSVVESRRGFALYGSAFPSVADRAKQLFTYKLRLLRHYFDNDSGTNILQYDSDGKGSFLPFAGTYTEPEAGLRIKSIESNGNFYFTTDQGIEKISTLDASGLSDASGYIIPAGGVKAIDLSGRINLVQGNISGFLPQDSTVAYRIVWGTIDANNNLILGTPSQRLELYNPLINMLLLDYATLLSALDGIASNSLISNGNYVNTFKLPSFASASELYIFLQNLCETIDADILYADTVSVAPLQISTSTCSVTGGVATINFSSGNPSDYLSVGSRIYLSGFAPTSGSLDGPQQVTLTTSSSIQILTTAAAGHITTTGATINSYEYTARSPQPSAIPLQVGSPYLLPATPPTDDDLVSLQGTLQSIFSRLQIEPNATINNTTPTPQTSVARIYIAPLAVTSTATAILTFTIPQAITTNYFYQVYRSNILQATGTTVLTNLIPSDEMKLVLENYVTAADITAGFITVEDITPASFAGAFLYSNQVSGEGALQTNDVPPFALDINRFKNTIFFANTKTRQNIQLNLLGVANIVSGYNPSNPPKLTITDGTTTNTYTFVLGKTQVTTITTNAGSTLASSGPASYFTINDANDVVSYYVWYPIGTATDPAIANKIGIKVDTALSSDSNIIIANKTRDALYQKLFDFTVSSSSNIITVTNVGVGYTSNPTAGTSGFVLVVTTSGSGENATTKQILLSNNVSPSQAVDETARSIIRVINKNSSETIYAYYLSAANGVPGQLFLESRNIKNSPFYLLANDKTTGSSFSPDLSPDLTISAISVATQAVITTTTPHLLVNGNSVVISDSNSTPIVDGLYPITYISATQFSIPVTTTVAGTQGVIKVSTDAVFSSNNALPNRIFYSKLNQPEAVPIVNYLDIGAKDKAILRIFPLRDSLFVYKEDGLYRISGELAPFTVSLFDGSTILLAPDSLGLCGNLIYGWTTQGISSTSESGVSTVSRPIDIDILKLASNNYPNFPTVTWGIGYESDNSYTVYTNQNIADTEATIGYRYSNLTTTWTTIDKTETCGVINTADDKMYMGAGDINYIEQERKTFTRLDYADRELTSIVNTGAYFGYTIGLPSVGGMSAGDAFVQNQLLTTYTYNSLLLKLNIDTLVGVAPISSISLGLTPLITTTVNHNLLINQYVTLTATNSKPLITGTYKVIAVPSATTFNVLLTNPITVAGTSGIAKLDYYQSLIAVGGNDLSVNIITLANTLDGDPSTQNKNYYDLIKPISGTITANSISDPTVVTCNSHGLVSGREIIIIGSNSVPSIDGTYIVTVLTNNTFSIPVKVNITAGSTGTFTTQNTSFQDIQACYNAIINNLNVDNGVSFKNYIISNSTTELEAIILSVNSQSKAVTLNIKLDYIVGPVTIFKAINVEFTYAPNTMGDSMSLKHFRESTVMFENKAFTNAIYSFASDLHPSFIPVPFNGDGNGIFGTPQFGTTYFGGGSNGAPFRTLVPAQCQRCRYLLLRFNHTVAREKISIFGISVTGELTSSRAYR